MVDSDTAISRAIIAIMENHQLADGTIRVPSVLLAKGVTVALSKGVMVFAW